MTFLLAHTLRTLTVRTFCAALVASLVLVGHIHAAKAATAMPTADTVPVVAEADLQQAAQEASRGTGERCQASGFCWILPARVASTPDRIALVASLAGPKSDRTGDKWTSSPPDQPPRPKEPTPL